MPPGRGDPELSPDEEVLPGGNMGGAVRIGAVVRRPAGPWSPTIQRLLRHLRERGVLWTPEPLGFDQAGRDLVSYRPGVVPQHPLPQWIWADPVLMDAGRRLAELHRASVSFDRVGAVWRLPVHEPAEVICHNDFAPYNMVFTDGTLSGVIDWDTASPGPRVWDLAYLAYRLVPLTGRPDPGSPPGDALRPRLIRLLQAYGGELQAADVVPVVIRRLHDLAAFTQARADEGRDHLRSHVQLYLDDALWVTERADRFA